MVWLHGRWDSRFPGGAEAKSKDLIHCKIGSVLMQMVFGISGYQVEGLASRLAAYF
jgi:hypothetical protein